MIALLDVNVLVALFDGAHVHHEHAHRWLDEHKEAGWATCPITENGLVRVVSNPSYPGRRTTVEDACDRLKRFLSSGGHSFWPDDVSLADPSVFRHRRIGGPARITDAYLLALAIGHRGRLVTFDRKLATGPVAGARSEHVVVIPAGT